MQEPCQRFWHEQMRYPSLESREFNHKIFVDMQILNGAGHLITCTIVVQIEVGALF
jgi:hypothetical protein